MGEFLVVDPSTCTSLPLVIAANETIPGTLINFLHALDPLSNHPAMISIIVSPSKVIVGLLAAPILSNFSTCSCSSLRYSSALSFNSRCCRSASASAISSGVNDGGISLPLGTSVEMISSGGGMYCSTGPKISSGSFFFSVRLSQHFKSFC
jgi:hypothetical protein